MSPSEDQYHCEIEILGVLLSLVHMGQNNNNSKKTSGCLRTFFKPVSKCTESSTFLRASVVTQPQTSSQELHSTPPGVCTQSKPPSLKLMAPLFCAYDRTT